MALSSYSKLQLIRTSILLLVLLDVAATTILFLRVGSGRNVVQTITSQITTFNVGVSLFDLWLLCLLRVILFTLLVSAFCFSKVVVLKRVKQLASICAVVLVLIFCYAVTKLLASFEFYEDGRPVRGSNITFTVSVVEPCEHAQVTPCPSVIGPSEMRLPSHPWLWAAAAWSALSALVYGILYHRLTRIESNASLLRNRHLYVNIETGEETSLLGGQTYNKEDSGSTTKSRKQSTLKVMWTIVTYTKPNIHLYIAGFSFLIISSSAMSFIPYYTGQVINHIAISPSTDEFERAILIMVAISIISAVAAGLRGSILIVANGRLNISIRETLFASLMNQEIGFFDQTETGDLTSRLTSDTTKLSDQIGLNLNIFLRNFVTFIGSLVFMIRLTWKLSTITLTGIPVITMVTHYFGNKFKVISNEIQESFAKANNVAEECLSSMRTVRSFANEEAEIQHYGVKLKHTLRIYTKKAVVYGSWMLSNNLLELVLQVVTLYYGGHLVINYEMTGGELVSLLLYQVSLSAAIDAMASVMAGLMEAVGAAEKVFELIDRQPKIDHHSGIDKPDKLDGVVEFKKVSFSYPSRPDVEVLKNISFTAQPGEVVALVGPSGGGKSSCISMLERFYEPQSGCVLVDGRPLSQYDHAYLHTRMSLVGQEPVLYARSVAENIACCMESATQEDIEHAAKLANAHDFITAMRDGYDTQTGEKGAQLSGGQKQRVAIARALIRNPTVLLLDEATSALDAESEHLVQQALNRNLQGRTVIIIAHRLSTVENADRIIVINKGQVIEQGSHSDLLKQKGGMYSMLVRKQMVADEERSSWQEGQLLQANDTLAEKLGTDSGNESPFLTTSRSSSEKCTSQHHHK